MPGVPLTEAMSRYLSDLAPAERARAQAEIGRFVRWIGQTVPTDRLTPDDIERYQDYTEKTGLDPQRLEPLKAFLAYLHRQGWHEANLGRFIKARRTARRATGKTGPAAATPPREEEVMVLTPEGYAALQKELEYLVTVKRPEIARILYEARLDKDIRENAPYDAAKHHQAEVEARIRYLERVLATARVVDPRSVETNGERATLGARVVLRDLTTGEELVYTLVGPTEANPLEGRLSVASPVGRAILDRRPGEEVEVEAPAGRVRFRIERIER